MPYATRITQNDHQHSCKRKPDIMIGKLTGAIDHIETDHVILDVMGVGYVVFSHSRDLTRMGTKGENASFWIDMIVREDAMSLYGFLDKNEQAWFRLLRDVQGVGAKAALSILQVCPPKQLQFALASQDKASLTQADGVGPKLATRIVTELKDKAANMAVSSNLTHPQTGTGTAAVTSDGEADITDMQSNEDAVSALVNFGYSRSDAYGAVKKVLDTAKANDNKEPELQQLIKMALKELNK